VSGGPGTLDPQVLSAIADLELVARVTVDGTIAGLHRSPFHGYSAEFNQYRPYRPGDDLKYVDWKLAARTDRIYTKQFRETTNMAAALVIDTSASMAFAGRSAKVLAERHVGVGRVLSDPPERVSKFRYASICAAALAHVISTQGDAVGLVASRGDSAVHLSPRTGRHHLRRLLAELSSLEALGTWRPEETIRRAAERLKRRGLLLVFSDFYDREELTLRELRRASRLGHEVLLFHTMTRDELELPYRQDVELTDLETGQRVTINAPLARRDYTDRVAAFLEEWRTRAASEGFHHTLMVTDMRPDRALRTFLIARKG
jgi:uncharacterized protein (DUF58 family)